jgi:hypothetical protein
MTLYDIIQYYMTLYNILSIVYSKFLLLFITSMTQAADKAKRNYHLTPCVPPLQTAAQFGNLFVWRGGNLFLRGAGAPLRRLLPLYDLRTE